MVEVNHWSFRRYTPADEPLWNGLVVSSVNGTFLLDRRYMDYHAHRFTDASLIAYAGTRPVAVLPANVTTDGVLHTHQGLTYGGWTLPRAHTSASDILTLFEAWTAYCRQQGYTAIDYKPVPHIYRAVPDESDIYALWRLGAEPTETAISSTILLSSWPGLSTMQRRHLKKALTANPRIEEPADSSSFMHMLTRCLAERHNAVPVHTADELNLLRSRFPGNIRVFTASVGDFTHAGVCIYDTGVVAHAQYIASTPEGRQLNLLTPLFHHLITRIYPNRRYFDFGISTEQGGSLLNHGLLRQKTSYGAGTSIYQRFTLQL